MQADMSSMRSEPMEEMKGDCRHMYEVDGSGAMRIATQIAL